MLEAGGCNISQRALRSATVRGDLGALQVLLDLGVQAEGCGALTWAARTGSLAAVEALLAAGVPVTDMEVIENDGGTYRWSPMGEATANGHTAVMQRLIAAGAGVERLPEDIKGDRDSLLELAPTAEVAQVLIDAGAQLQDPGDNNVPLVMAAAHGRRGVVATLLTAGADVHAAYENGCSALHAAISEDCVRLLLASGASLCAVDSAGRTPLHTAAEHGAFQAVGALLAAGASPHAVDDSGQTPLTAALTGSAVLSGCWADDFSRVLATLLAAGAVPSTADLTAALSNQRLTKGPWMLGLLPPSRSVSGAQLREWAGAAFQDPASKQALVWGTWALRGRLPPELLRLIAAMHCLLGG